MVNITMTIIVLLALIGVELTVLTTPTISATSNNATSTNTSQQVVDQPHFKADLRGIQQFSPNTNASGEAYFWSS